MQVGNLKDVYHFILSDATDGNSWRRRERYKRGIRPIQFREDKMRTISLQREENVCMDISHALHQCLHTNRGQYFMYLNKPSVLIVYTLHLSSTTTHTLNTKSPCLTRIITMQVGYVMQQKLLQMEKKNYHPPYDPQWHSQWSLVSSADVNVVNEKH